MAKEIKQTKVKRVKRKLGKHAKSDSKLKTSKKYKKPYNKQG